MAEDEGKRRQEVSRGQQAKELLEHPLVVAFLADAEARYTKRWRDSRRDDVEGREEAFKYLDVLQCFRDEMKRHITTGKMAEKTLAEKFGLKR